MMFPAQWRRDAATPLAVGAFALIALVASACTDRTPVGPSRSPTTLAAATLIISPVADTVIKGDTVRFVARMSDGSPTGAVEWHAYDAKITSLGNGLYRGVSVGSSTVYAVTSTLNTSAPLVVKDSVTTTKSGATFNTPPVLPQRFVATAYSAPGGRIIPVKAGMSLQTAIDTARGGDILALAPGAVFKGNFILRAKGNTSTIVIRSAAPDAQLPAEGKRMTPAYAASLPKIVSPNFSPAIATVNGAMHYRLMELEVTVDPSITDAGAIVNLGDASGGQTSLSQVPTQIVLDRMYIHGHSTLNVRRCVGLHSSWTGIVDSYLSECHSRGYDTQAIWGGNGPGPFKIVNNYLEGSGENVMFGGGDPTITGLIPSDIVIRHNHFFKPLSWRGGVWTAKNLLELKNSQRVLIEGNVFQNSWVDGQTGFALNLKSHNQDGGCPWCVTRNVTIRYNQILNTAGGIVFSGQANGNVLNELLHDVLVTQNTYCSLGNSTVDPNGDNGRMFLLVEAIKNIEIDHETGFAPKAEVGFDVDQKTGFAFGNNATGYAMYGVWGSGAGQGIAALTAYTPNDIFLNNAFVGSTTNPYPLSTSFYPSASAIGFVNAGSCDFHLTSTSPLRGAATDGTDIGANANAIASYTQGVVVP